jgi:hypothetical protein
MAKQIEAETLREWLSDERIQRARDASLHQRSRQLV